MSLKMVMKWFSIWVMAIGLTMAGCASSPEAPPDPQPGVSTPPGDVSANPRDRGLRELPKVTLVLGGVGVSSFATVGLLKRFEQEGVEIQKIVATGWPALFTLGYGFLKSVHDLEWQAMRLSGTEFFDRGFFSFNKDFSDLEAISEWTNSKFAKRDLREAKIPVVLTSTQLGRSSATVFSSGDWKGPLLGAMATPGIYRPYRGTGRYWVTSIEGVDVKSAVAKGSTVIAVDMYQDYLRFQDKKTVEGSGDVFRKIFLADLRNRIQDNLNKAPISARIELNRDPGDFKAKRQAILAGYREATRLIQELRRSVSE